jgi:hypothetical protein
LNFTPVIFQDFFRGKSETGFGKPENRKTGSGPDLRPGFSGGLATGKSYNFGFYVFLLII